MVKGCSQLYSNCKSNIVSPATAFFPIFGESPLLNIRQLLVYYVRDLLFQDAEGFAGEIGAMYVFRVDDVPKFIAGEAVEFGIVRIY